MPIRRAPRAALLAALLALPLAACGGGDDGGGEDGGLPADFGARFLRLGEPVGAVVEARQDEFAPGLQAVLNPEAVAALGAAVADGGDRLDLAAETAGQTAEAFRAGWEADRDAAFARFAAGLRASGDADDIRGRLFLGPLAALPVHPDGALVGAARIDTPDGQRRYFLIYDVPSSTGDAEDVVARQLDVSPWQVTGGQSAEAISNIQFRSTVSADVEGAAWVQPIDDSRVLAAAAPEDGDGEDAEPYGGPFASVLYLIQTQPPEAAGDEPFEPPAGRPLPAGFPAAFLVGEDATVSEVAWNTEPGVVAFRVTVLVRESAFAVAETWRDRLEAEGWELTGDRAEGFATTLEFASEDGSASGTASFDALEEDDRYTEVVLFARASTGGDGDE